MREWEVMKEYPRQDRCVFATHPHPGHRCSVFLTHPGRRLGYSTFQKAATPGLSEFWYRNITEAVPASPPYLFATRRVLASALNRRPEEPVKE